MVPYLLSVDVEFIQSGGGNVGTRRLYLFACLEFLTEIRCRLVMNILAITNPSSLPMLHPHHTHFKTRDGRSNFLMFHVTADYLPVIFSERSQFLACIGHKQITGSVPAAIPHPATAVDHVQRVFVYYNLPGSLHSSLPAVLHPPGKAWGRIVDTYRTVKMLAPQICQANRSLPLNGSTSKECK